MLPWRQAGHAPNLKKKMPDRKFPILGASVPPMLGRAAIMQRMLGALTKPVPDHLQVVGPRFAGKTVIINELARRLRQTGSPYTAVLIWDLGHQTPGSDEVFMQDFAWELSGALAVNHSDYAEHLKNPQGNPYRDIGEVLEAVTHGGGKVLAIMDGFDKPLSSGQLTRNLWDQLRSLALGPGLRLVTGSRRTLRNLIRDSETLTSPLWEIFNPSPVRVGCFDEADLAAVLEQMPEIRLTAGAQTELWNASNGFPVIMLEVLNVLCGYGKTGEINPDVVRIACEEAFPSLRDIIDALWADCSSTSQDLQRYVQERGTLGREGTASADVDTLIECGFLHQVGNKLQRPSRLLERYFEEQPNEGGALARLFGGAESYQKNFRGVLERRIVQIKGMDETLRHYLHRGTEDLPDQPGFFLGHVRGIVNHAFELIWKAELGGKKIPSEWMATWKYNRERGIDDWQTAFPQGVHRVRLLNLMTGTQSSDPCAKHVTKSTYVLMNAAHAFGEFGQHQEGTPIDPGTAYAALHVCIELAAALTRELPS
jgi:hypothetical protein